MLRSLGAALALALLLQACGPDAAPAASAKSLARTQAIKKRLEEPFFPLPGARFVRRTDSETARTSKHFLFSGQSESNASSGKTQLGAAFAMDLNGLDLSALQDEAIKIAPGQWTADFGRLKTWDGLVAAAEKRERTLVSEFLSAAAFHFADYFSGLGLRPERLSEWDDKDALGGTWLMSDSEGTNVVEITLLFSLPPSKAYVSISFLSHFNATPAKQDVPDAAAWGTRSP